MSWAWEYFAFLANSFVFILIGMNVSDQPLGLGLVDSGRRYLYRPRRSCPRGLSARGAVHGSRWRLPVTFQHTLFWGGLRGALALALALAVPETVPERGAIILTAFIVVAFSILVQGLTMPWLIERFGLAGVSRRHGSCRGHRTTLAPRRESRSRRPSASPLFAITGLPG